MGVRLTLDDFNSDPEAIDLDGRGQSSRTFWAAVLRSANDDLADVIHFRLDRGDDCLALEIRGEIYPLTPPPAEWRPFFLSAARRMAAGGLVRSMARTLWRRLRRSDYLGTISLESPVGIENWRVEAVPDGLIMKHLEKGETEVRARDAKYERLARKWSDAVHASRTAKANVIARKIVNLFEPVIGKASAPSLAMSVIAQECEGRADWHGAEVAYLQSLALEEPGIGTYSAHSYLSGLYHLLGREEKGVEHRRLATVAARDADGVILLMALLAEADDHLRREDIVAASALLPEIFRALEETGPTLPQFRARALRIQAACHLASGDREAAAADLERATDLLESANRSCDLDAGPRCGVESDLAQCWKLQARLESLRGDFDGAARSWAKAIDSARRVASGMNSVYSKRFLAVTLVDAADSFELSGHRDRASEFRLEAQQIRDALRLPPMECG